MYDLLFSTDPSAILPLILRLSVGAIMLPHGTQKLFGWFGGYGFSGTMGFLTQTMRLPWLMGLLVILIESVGSLFLLVGLFTRLSAMGLIAVMLGAVLTSHVQHGFFMNWDGDRQGEGYEFHLLVIGMAVALLISGSGALSLDAVLYRLLTQ
jgi:putative oxidoreductase